MKKTIVFLILAVCVSTTAFGEAKAQKGQTELVSSALLDRAGWTLAWQVRLPIRPQEATDRLFVFDDYLYVLSDSNFLFCLDRKTGAMRFVMQLSTRGLPVCNPLYREKKLWFLIGNEMVTVDPWAGTVADKHRFIQVGNTFECGLSLNDDSIYITGSDRRLHVFNRDGWVRRFTATADNDAPIVSVRAMPDKVMFATMQGNVVAMAANAPTKIWQFNTTGPIRSELVLEENRAYIGSDDNKLYCLDAHTGRLVWTSPFQAGARLREPVVPGREILYLPAGLMGVYGVDKTSGQAVWQAPEGVAVLTETETQAFVFCRPGVLNVMDNVTGRQVNSVNFSRVTRYAAMMDEPVLFVADDKGRVAAIQVQ